MGKNNKNLVLEDTISRGDMPSAQKRQLPCPPPTAKARQRKTPPASREQEAHAVQGDGDSPPDSDFERSIEPFLENSVIEAVPQYIKLESKSLQNYKYMVGKLGANKAAYYIARAMESLAIDVQQSSGHPSWFAKDFIHPRPDDIGFVEVNDPIKSPGYWILQRKPGHLRRPMSYEEAADKFTASSSSSGPARSPGDRQPVWVTEKEEHKPKHDQATQTEKEEHKLKHDQATQTEKEEHKPKPKTEKEEAEAEPGSESDAEGGGDAHEVDRDEDDKKSKQKKNKSHNPDKKSEKKLKKERRRQERQAAQAARDAELRADDERAANASPSPAMATIASSSLVEASIPDDCAADDPYIRSIDIVAPKVEHTVGTDISDILPDNNPGASAGETDSDQLGDLDVLAGLMP
jgi:hypothetical protein